MSFGKLVSEIEKGAIVAQLDGELASLISAIRATGKKGAITLKIEIAPASTSAEVLSISADVKVKAPEPDRTEEIFFANEKNELSRNNPRQLSLTDLKKPSESTGADNSAPVRLVNP